MSIPFTLILLAAGSARRMEGAVADKISAPLAGIPVIKHAHQAFLQAGGLTRLLVTYRDEAQRLKLEAALGASAVAQWIKGGAERQNSVLAALEACEGDGLVALHDAARPLILSSSILKVLQRAQLTGAAILASRASDTIKLASPSGEKITDSPERSHVWMAETPQVFRLSIVLEAYRRAAREGQLFTDDAGAVSATGHDVALVEGDGPNLKLTRPSDFTLAEALFKARS